MKNDPNPVADFTMFGGKPVAVKFRDPARPPVTVTVRELKPSEFPAFLTVRHDMTKAIEFVTDQQAGFADSLHPDSLFDLDEEGEKLNPTFGRWLERQGPRLAKLAAMERLDSGASASARGSR